MMAAWMELLLLLGVAAVFALVCWLLYVARSL
jgi:hypothetical protein